MTLKMTAASLAMAGSACAQVVIYDSGGFEGFAPGPVAGQDGWTVLSTNGMAPLVVSGGGNPSIGAQSVRVEVPDFTPAYSIIGRTFPDLMSAGFSTVTIRFSIYREPSAWSSNVWRYTYEQQGGLHLLGSGARGARRIPD